MKAARALPMMSRSGFYSEHFNGIAIDSEFARDQALFWSLWQAWHTIAQKMPRLQEGLKRLSHH